MSCEEIAFSGAILKRENIYLLTGFRFQVVAFPRGRLSWVGFTSPRDLDQGTTLLVNTTLKFAATARLDGNLSFKAMNALEGPCLAFQSDAFVAASAELHFANCNNIVEYDRKMPDEVNGGAMNVRGSLTVMGTLTIRDCRTQKGKGGSLGSNYGTACLQELMMEGLKKLICGFAMLSFRVPLVLQNRLLGGLVAGFSLLLPPSLRCDCREAGFSPQRKHLHHQFFGRETWRCPAPEFFWGRDNLAVACGGSTGSQKRSYERLCVDVSGRVLLANWTLCHMAFVLFLMRSRMFSSISSP